MSSGSDEVSEKSREGSIQRTFQAFRYRNFRLLWGGAFTSTTGTWMQMVAQSWVVLELTGSAFYLGLVGFRSPEAAADIAVRSDGRSLDSNGPALS
jgi:hypothetical protein